MRPLEGRISMTIPGGRSQVQAMSTATDTTPSGWAMDTSLSTANASFYGEKAIDLSGSSVAGAGDVNGDGYDDILIGAYGNDEGGVEVGQTYLIFGKSSGWTMHTNISNADASFWGEKGNDISGLSIAGAGDVNGDGYSDFLIGAYGNDDGGADAGQTYLLLGNASGWAMDTNLSKASASFWGEDSYDDSGWAVAGAGDVNGDGYDDIIIGAYMDEEGGNAAGQAYLIFGKATGWAMDSDLSAANASFKGEITQDNAGYSVASAGDVNGDRYNDILIGSVLNDDGGSSAGQVYLILGKKTGWAMDTVLSNSDASFWGEDSSDLAGYSISGAGDVNGDGRDDILIGARFDEEGGAFSGQTYLIFVHKNIKPTAINSVMAYSDDAFSLETKIAAVNDIVYIELKGTDGNSKENNTALVKITSSASDKTGFLLRLIETGKNTGKYRGNLTIKSRTYDQKGWIHASDGETVNISSAQNPLKYCTVSVVDTIELSPSIDNGTSLEDTPYKEHYWATNLSSIKWTFSTNASWLTWNTVTHNVSGTPDNGDVGSYYVRINISRGTLTPDEHNFTLVVNNAPPTITTNDVHTAVEDKPYNINYNSNDDGQGSVTWHLATDAGNWLSIDPGTGVLKGTPTNDHVGIYYVNVSVDDGNTGKDWSNFTLTVLNTNDAPTITSQDQLSATEDSLYSAQYVATDIDIDDSLSWHLTTNASSWLTISPVNGLLSGLPTNDNVGIYWVNVTVTDKALASDSRYFAIRVINTNDLPIITSSPVLTAQALIGYRYDVNASDVDAGDVLTFSLDKRPANMTIVPTTGLIDWTPSRQQVGINHVIVNVSDGDSWVRQDFNITVLAPPAIIPNVTLISPVNGAKLTGTSQVLTWSWEDPDSATVFFDVYLSKVRLDVENKELSAKVSASITKTTLTMDQLENGTIYFWTVIPNDGANVGTSKSGIWSFKVAETVIDNKAPSISSTPIKTALVGTQYQYKVVASDADGDKLNYELISGPDGMIIDPVAGLIVWTPTAAQVGDQIVTLRVSDGTAAVTQTYNVVVTKSLPPVNNKPVIVQISDKNIKVSEEFVYPVEASDTDKEDVLSFMLEHQPTGMTISPQGLISWTPSKDQLGAHMITVRVSDGKENATVQFKITVEKKTTPRTHNGLDTAMLGIIAAVVMAIIMAIVAVIVMRRKRKAPEVSEVEAKNQEPVAHLMVVPTLITKKPNVKTPPTEKVEQEIKANLEDEIDLDDLDDED
jgi:hypothetical protein